MSNIEHTPPLEIVRAVTGEHADKFVEAWQREMLAGMDMLPLVDATRIMARPDDEDDDEAGQDRYDAIAHEILRMTCAAAAPAMREAFLRVARAVLKRERARR
jgi:malate/lactate dehydrogenase